MAKPSFPFYPDDWMNDLGLRGCSPASRAIWMDLMCMMHQGVPYGFLSDIAGPLAIKFIAGRCGVTARQLGLALAELESHNVFSRDEAGTIYSRRMLRDEHNRIARGQGGQKALGNPSVPRPKGILATPSKGILPSGEPEVSFGPEEVKDITTLSIVKIKPKPSWESLNEAWKWFAIEYPGEVNPFMDQQLFISVMETAEDIADLRTNLPLWKSTKRWQDGYFFACSKFIGERIFKIRPKDRDSPKLTASQIAMQRAREEDARNAQPRESH